MKQKLLCLLLAVIILVSTGCGFKTTPAEEEIPPVKIGVSFPNNTETKWSKDAETIRTQLESKGYSVDLQFADDSSETQISQLQSMIDAGCETLIVAAVDPSAMDSIFHYTEEDIAPPADSSAEAEQVSSEEPARVIELTYDGTPVNDGLNVIAYDRLITDCNAIDYYIGFDGYEAGYLQACFIETELALYDAQEGDSYTIEFSFGDADSTMLQNQFEGAMEVLQMYLDSGVLKTASGETDLASCTSDSPEAAADRITAILAKSYPETNLDAILCSDDTLAAAVSDSVFEHYTGTVFPLITGMGCAERNVNDLLSRKQSMTLLKDYTGMAEEAAAIASVFAEGGTPDSTESMDNGSITIPSSLFYPEEVNADNYQQKLVTREYFAISESGTLEATTDFFSGYYGTRDEETTEEAQETASSEEGDSSESSASES